jgi:citrate synthase
MSIWHECGTDLNAWSEHAGAESPEFVGTWPAREHLAGFEPHGVSRTLVVSQLLEKLTAIAEMPNLSWLAKNKHELEKLAGLPLAICGVAAATLADLGFTPKEGEMLYLLLRLPGAAAHALEQERLGYKKFPFYPVELEDDPKRKEVR